MATNQEPTTHSAAGPASLAFTGDMRGMDVHGRDGDKLGTIDKLVLDKRTGQVAFVVLSSGGFLGLGQGYHPIPWPAFRYDSGRDGYVVALDKRLLEGSPTYRPDTAPVFDEIYGQRVREYYRAALEGVS